MWGKTSAFAFFVALALLLNTSPTAAVGPVVISTWNYISAIDKAWDVLYVKNLSAIDAVEAGCAQCEEEQCRGTVGFGGSPDENGETTLDSMLMDGTTMNMGAVGGLRGIKNAVGVARHVLDRTEHSFLVGDLAADFAVRMGFKKESLSTEQSTDMWKNWKTASCQPNFWRNVKPDPSQSCGPYAPNSANAIRKQKYMEYNSGNHDTIGVVAVDRNNNVAAGTSTNGANHKIPGRVGDSPIPGAGAYADSEVGAAVATGDGDYMMRFLPSFFVVEEMRRGTMPRDAAEKAIARIKKFHPNFFGAVVALRKDGKYGFACNGMPNFPYTIHSEDTGTTIVGMESCS